MSDTLVLIVTTVLSLGLAVAGVLLSRRAARLARENRIRRQLLFQSILNDLDYDNLDPETKMIIGRVIESGLLNLSATMAAHANGEVTKAGPPRTGSDQRTVEVESRDGSKSTLRVDPTDTDSIGDFVDAARRIDTKRVLAVH